MAAPQPTLASFLTFIRKVMGISATVLPDDSPVIPFAFAVAFGIVNQSLQCIPIPSQDAAGVSLNSGGFSIYSLAVNNLAADNLINYAQDIPGAAIILGSGEPGLAFFAWTRSQWNINGFVSGVISGSSDESTSQTLVVQEAAKAFTLSNLQNLKTPYGRTYLGLAQSWGPSTFGIS